MIHSLVGRAFSISNSVAARSLERCFLLSPLTQKDVMVIVVESNFGSGGSNRIESNPHGPRFLALPEHHLRMS